MLCYLAIFGSPAALVGEHATLLHCVHKASGLGRGEHAVHLVVDDVTMVPTAVYTYNTSNMVPSLECCVTGSPCFLLMRGKVSLLPVKERIGD